MKDDLVKIFTYKARLTNAQRFEFATNKKSKGYKTRIGKKGINGVQLKRISGKLTGVLKLQISKQGHVDTGRMFNQTKVRATVGARGELVAIVLSRVDYWKYVDGNFDILKNAMKTRKWKEVEKQFNEFNQGHPKRK